MCFNKKVLPSLLFFLFKLQFFCRSCCFSLILDAPNPPWPKNKELLLSNALGTFLLDLCKKISHSSVLCNSQNSVWFSRFTSNRMYLTQNNGQERIEEGKNSSNCSNTDEFLMSFFFYHRMEL